MSIKTKGYQIILPEIKTAKSLQADVVVIGGGGAGIPAALTALEEGAKSVIVLEKRFATGGDGLRCNHIFGVGSRLQKSVGSTLSKDSFLEKNLASHHCDRVNPKIIRNFIYRSADTIDWLEKEGIVFKLLVSMSALNARGKRDPKMATTHVEKDMPEPDSLCSLGKMFRHLTQKAADDGVQFLVRTSAKKVIRGKDGKITGVIAQTKNGQQINIKTKSVILCTGSFIGNKELLKKYFPDRYIDDYASDALRTNTGDGIPIAEDAGAAMEPYCTLLGHGGAAPTVVNNQRTGVTSPITIRVNKEGKRFFAENLTTALGSLQLNQPGKMSYSLFDDKMLQSSMERTMPPQHPRIPTPPETWLDAKTYIQKYARRGEWIKMANTWDEIAKWMGCDPKVLKATINEYNSFCDKGLDKAFGKEAKFLVPLRTPPFYANRSGVNMFETMGPVRINENMEIMDKDNKPIPGFYAAGVITSGWVSCSYHVEGMAGTALSYSMTSGRIAGENAAKYVQRK